MAPPKRLRITPLDDPPTASSSSDDDQPPSSKNQPPSSKKPEDVVDEVDDSDEEEETDEEDDEDEEEGSSSEEEEQVQPQPPSKNPPPSIPNSNPKPDSGSESESGSESGSESDSVQEATPPNAVKPLVSKPMKAQPQAQAQSTPVPARSGTKRANENGSKPAKKKTTGGGGSKNEANEDGDVEDSKKMNQRVFSEDDEIAILKGLADFISKTEKDPMKDPVAFHSFVKKSIRANATSEQLKRKVRNLKTKFKDGGSFTKEHDKKAFELSKKVWGNTEGNLKMKFKDGGSFTKEHDKKVFELSKKIWGNTKGNNGGNEGEENGKVNEKTPKSTKKEAPVRNNGSAKKCKFGEAAERGMGLLEESKAEEFEEGWRKVQIAEIELFVIQAQLLTNRARIALEAMKKSTN